MATTLTPTLINQILSYDDEQRAQYFIKEVVENNTIWLLKDEHGCVMLNTDEEDCVPVWPNKEFAHAWATDEWQHCEVEAISLNKWYSRWTSGLLDDELAIVVFPSEDEQGLVYYPDELEQALKQKQQAKNRR